MSLISDFLNLSALAKKANEKINVGENSATDTAMAFANVYKSAQAISARASKFILQYPVACSDSITNYKTGVAIAKQVEFDCARFYLLASGLDPVIDVKHGDTIQAHLDRLTNATEAYVRNKYPAFGVKISKASEEDIMHATEALEIANTPFSISSQESVLARTVFSKESDDDVETESVDTSFDDTESDDESQFTDDLTDDESKDPKKKDRKFSDTYLKEHDLGYSGNGATGVFDTKQFEKLGKSAPTVVTIELILNDQGGQRTVKVPLAFKSDLQFVPHQDIVDLLNSADTKANKFMKTLIKLTSGEMKVFKDWLFAIDDAKNDVDKEYTIGRVPILRRLMSAKNAYRTKNMIAGALWFTSKDFRKKVEEMFNLKHKQKELPMVTLVVTEQDFELGTGKSINKAMEPNSKIVQAILDNYMLLGLGIIDELNDVGYFFYSGEEGFTTIELSKMGSNSSDKPVNDKLTEVLAAMSKMITRH